MVFAENCTSGNKLGKESKDVKKILFNLNFSSVAYSLFLYRALLSSRVAIELSLTSTMSLFSFEFILLIFLITTRIMAHNVTATNTKNNTITPSAIGFLLLPPSAAHR